MPVLNQNTFCDTNPKILTLLNGVTLDTSGAWEQVRGYQPLTVSVEGDFVGSVQLYGSLKPGNTPPADADANHAILLPAAIIVPQILSLSDIGINWVKAVVTFVVDPLHEIPAGTCWAYAFVG